MQNEKSSIEKASCSFRPFTGIKTKITSKNY